MKLILGVTGSIAAYKAVDLMKMFLTEGHEVSVIMTRSAGEFITPLSFETFNAGRVYTCMFDEKKDPLLHINICRDHDLLLIAPASANIIGKMAHGIADDLLSTTFLAFYKQVIIAPAMNTHMFENKAVQANLDILKSRDIDIIEPDEGMLACKAMGKGKFPGSERIYKHCMEIMKKNV